MGSGVRGLASPNTFLGATTSLRLCSRSSSSPSCSCSGGTPDSLSARSECQIFELYAELGTWWWSYSFRALLGSTVDNVSCLCSGVLLDVFSLCLWYSALKSILSCSPVWEAALVVDLGYGMCLLVLLVTVHLALCSLRFCWPENGEVAQTMLRLLICLNLEIIFMSPLFLAVTCSPSGHCAEEFLGALDDEKFFVVDRSGWRGRRESDSQVTCRPN